MHYVTRIETPLGRLVAASDGVAVVGLWFEGQAHFGATLDETRERADDLPVFEDLRRWLNTYFEGRDPGPHPACSPKGTPFRLAVWRELAKVPYGSTVTYGELGRRVAHELGRDSWSARAVGGAVGHNPISILLPCHRVVGADGSLTGYAGGVETKAALLALEGVDVGGLRLPRDSALPASTPSAAPTPSTAPAHRGL